MSRDSADAVVIGAGHNGLVAAAMLADAGWDVLVLEAQAVPGGAVKSAELFPGYISDLFSAFYPLSVASPALRALHLEDHGLRWTHAPAVVGHARSADDDDAPVIYREIDRTAADLERRATGDGSRWRALFDQWLEIKDAVLSTLFSPFPPVRGPLQLLRSLGTADALRLAHLLMLPAGVMAEQLFDGEAARLLLLGNAMHADVPIDAPGSGVMGYLLIMMAQDGGFPVPVGGAGQLTAALVNRARSAGARIECGQEVEAIDVRGGRAVAVRTTSGARVDVRRAVIADTSAPRLLRDLLPADVIPEAIARDHGPVRLGYTGSQDQLRFEFTDTVAVDKSQGRRYRAYWRRPQWAHPVDGRPEHCHRSAASVLVVRSNDNRRSNPFTARYRKRLGLYAFATRGGRRRIC